MQVDRLEMDQLGGAATATMARKTAAVAPSLRDLLIFPGDTVRRLVT